MYRRKFGRWGDFRRPQRFTEHLTARILYDRGENLSWTCDKLAMKDYAKLHCPGLLVPRTLWSGTDLEELDLTALPDQWVIKPNHSSGFVYFGSKDTTLTEMKKATRGWLRPYDRAAVGEWAYGQARRLLVIEPRLDSPDSGAPSDYKFLVFHGKVRLMHCDAERYTEDFYETFYSPEWEMLDIRNGVEKQRPMAQPQSFERMVAYAERLARSYSFMRVDFYEVDGEPWFGELTPYPSGGMDPFEPDEVDFMLGSWWREEEPA